MNFSCGLFVIALNRFVIKNLVSDLGNSVWGRLTAAGSDPMIGRNDLIKVLLDLITVNFTCSCLLIETNRLLKVTWLPFRTSIVDIALKLVLSG